MDKKSCSLGNSYMKAQGTSPPQELICFRWGRVITYEPQRKREREALRFFPIITVTFFKNVEQMAAARININDMFAVQDYNSAAGFTDMWKKQSGDTKGKFPN